MLHENEGKGVLLKGINEIRKQASNRHPVTILAWINSLEFPAFRPRNENIWFAWSREVKQWLEWYFSEDSEHVSFSVWRSKFTELSRPDIISTVKRVGGTDKKTKKQ